MRDHSLNETEYMTTFSGRLLTLWDPQPEQIDIEDIAQALSNLCRFTGHCREFYSVAQHSVLVSYHVRPELAFQGLMHDAQEAYINDLSRPIKHHPDMTPYRLLEDGLEEVIRAKYGLPRFLDPNVKCVDNLIVVDEGRALLDPTLEWLKVNPCMGIKIVPWGPKEAREAFIERFVWLTAMKELGFGGQVRL